MPDFTLTIRNLRGLRHVRWSPRGVNVLVGANGAGKSTLLLALKLLRTAVDRGLPEAVGLVLGGSEGLKHHDATEEESVLLRVDLADLSWQVRLRPRGATVDHVAEEFLDAGGRQVYLRDALGNFQVGDDRWEVDERLGLRALHDARVAIPEVERMIAFLRSIAVFHDPDLHRLRRQGSNAGLTKHLHSRGLNALTMLRQWHQQRPDRWRYNFVLTGLKAAFPRVITDLDFREAGSTLVAQVYRPGSEVPSPLAHESNGLVAMLVALCSLASVDEGAVVAIDEVGNALHPFAQRVLSRRAEQLARKRGLTVLFATHNTVLLDHFDDRPEQVFALIPGRDPGPTALPDLRSPSWLSQFRLGELYADGELGSNDDGSD